MFRFFGNRIGRARLLLEKADDGKGGGGGDDGKGKQGDPPKDDAKDALIKDLQTRLAALEGKKADPPKDDDDLAAKAKAKRDQDAANQTNQKDLESALKFNLGGAEWLKTNEKMLPKEMADIFAQAEKQNYDSAIEKATAIKVGIISEFFKLQANLDLLTPTQKIAVEDFQKLAKNGKQEKAQQIYDNVFEPAFEMAKRIKKAELLQKSGHSTATDAETAYKERLMKGSQTHYGVKQHGT